MGTATSSNMENKSQAGTSLSDKETFSIVNLDPDDPDDALEEILGISYDLHKNEIKKLYKMIRIKGGETFSYIILCS